MATIAYPTKIEIDGPWLIEGQSLQQLDAVFDICIEKMRTDSARMLDASVEDQVAELVADQPAASDTELESLRARCKASMRLRHPFNIDHRTVVIFLSRGRHIEGARFAELAALPNVENEIPLGFVANAKVGVFDARVELSSSYSTSMTVSTSPPNDELTLETFGYLQNWALDIRPKTWQQFWLRHSWWAFLLFMVWLLVFTATATASGTDGFKEGYKREARALLSAGGVNTSNQLRAEELLLKIESDYVPSGQKQRAVFSHVWPYLAGGLLLIVAVAFSPKLAIGIWAGRAKLARQKLWISVITVSIPGLLISGVLIPQIVRWVGSSTTR